MKATPTSVLIDRIAPLVAPLGYELVHVEVITGRENTLRLFIDLLSPPSTGAAVGIEDCVKVTKALDEPLETLPEINSVFKGHYELEVSSPGVDRPLRTPKDFERFKGREVRIHVYRPLTAEELSNSTYQSKNPKQKNFLGTLSGFQNDQVQLTIPLSGSSAGEAGKKSGNKAKKKSALPTNSEEATKRAALAELSQTKRAALAESSNQVTIPLPLIAKANLEPRFEFENGDSQS